MPLLLRDTITWARSVPRSARVAQGFTRVTDFARAVQKLRVERAALRQWHPDPLRRNILDRLDRIVADRADLNRAARREAKVWWTPRMNVWWCAGKPHVYDGVRLIQGRYYPRRYVAVPATWLLARLPTEGPNVAVRVREADPHTHLLATPHWIERSASGALWCPKHWLTAAEWAQVEARKEAIEALREQRERSKPVLEWRRGDIYVGPSPVDEGDYRLTLGDNDRSLHSWPHWPSRIEIFAAVAEARRKQEAERKRAEWREAQQQAAAPSPDAPDSLGWRGWGLEGDVLVSPFQKTPWHDATLRAEAWSDRAAVQGTAGIHARRVPVDWLRVDPLFGPALACDVHGIVERFGRYVLGTEGWRAEWVVIRELLVPNAETALKLMRRYPEVRIHVREQEAIDGHR
jgi:hypothetical protein